ncbi:hypothetical protein RFI_10590 [Reticulomyxa filosa]|uniref:Uncharacterized protein n=1 Tax=Reticulomyxa filosa TaxID=46433 RepID=X6NKM8_RETFI|nr:hypothetical protein RFI_10590 [Reticulomyxa filosa]|eukprot:ETO26546.1 hypothetical protein RFI_10590 [Reticulomyxa filosa]
MITWFALSYGVLCLFSILIISFVIVQFTRDVRQAFCENKQMSKKLIISTYGCLFLYLMLQFSALAIIALPLRFCAMIGAVYGNCLVFSKILLYRQFIYRLELVFQGTVHAYSARYLYTLKIILLLFIGYSFVVGYLYSEQKSTMLSSCTPLIAAFVMVDFVIFDILITFTLTVSFLWFVYFSSLKTVFFFAASILAEKIQKLFFVFLMPLFGLIRADTNDASLSSGKEEPLVYLAVKQVTLVTICMVTTTASFGTVAAGLQTFHLARIDDVIQFLYFCIFFFLGIILGIDVYIFVCLFAPFSLPYIIGFCRVDFQLSQYTVFRIKPRPMVYAFLLRMSQVLRRVQKSALTLIALDFFYFVVFIEYQKYFMSSLIKGSGYCWFFLFLFFNTQNTTQEPNPRPQTLETPMGVLFFFLNSNKNIKRKKN